MAAAIARCGAKREAAITLLHADAPKDEEARNRAELELIQQEMSLIWTQARHRLPISVHSDRWGSNGPCLWGPLSTNTDQKPTVRKPPGIVVPVPRITACRL